MMDLSPSRWTKVAARETSILCSDLAAIAGTNATGSPRGEPRPRARGIAFARVRKPGEASKAGSGIGTAIR